MDGTYALGQVLTIELTIGGNTIQNFQAMGADEFVSTTGSQENYDGMCGLTPVPLR